MRVARWLAVVLGVSVASSMMGCAGLLGDFTQDESEAGVDSSVLSDANGNADGTVNGSSDAGPDADGSNDGTINETGSSDSPNTADDSPEDVNSPIDAHDSAPSGCGVGYKQCDAGCEPTSDPNFGCDTLSCGACNSNHDVPACDNGLCAIDHCLNGYTDCNNDPSDGCETSGSCPCTAESCKTGCCDSNGVCQTSAFGTCGLNGVKCVGCTTGQACNSAGACDCDPACTTCCSNHVCAPTEGPSTCGTGGGACSVCGTGTACGQVGTSYQCVCNAGTCGHGCCTSSNGPGTACVTTEQDTACGTGGALCAQCGSGLGCQADAGACECGPSTCAGGCCGIDATGQPICQTYAMQAPQYCGTNGASCIACPGIEVCSTGACVCPANGVKCPTNSCSDPMTDPANCGSCGHSCLDETCSGGQCVQTTIGSAAAGQGEGLAVTPTQVYYSVANGAGGSSVQFIKLPPESGCGDCSNLALGGMNTPGAISIGGTAAQNYVYAGVSGGSGAIDMIVNAQGSTVQNNAGPSGYGTGLVADTKHVYYALNGGGGIQSCLAGTNCTGTTPPLSTPTTVNSTAFATYMAVDDNAVLYYSDFASHVFRCTLPTCDPAFVTGTSAPSVLVLTGKATTFLFVDATYIYWIDRETTNLVNCDGHISRAKKLDGSSVTTYATNICYPQGIRADANNVYWGSTDGVYKCAIGGCTTGQPTQIGTSNAEVEWVDQDAQYVYWVNYGGLVYRVAK